MSMEVSERAQHLKESATDSQNTANSIYHDLYLEMNSALEQSKAVKNINVLTDSILDSRTDKFTLAQRCYRAAGLVKWVRICSSSR